MEDDTSFSTLQLQLAAADGFEWIDEFWKLHKQSQPGEISYLAHYSQAFSTAISPVVQQLKSKALNSTVGSLLGLRYNESFRGAPSEKGSVRKSTASSSASAQ